MEEIKLGTNGYLRVHSELDAEGNWYDRDIVDLWDVLGDDNTGATWRLAGGRFVGVAPLEAVEVRDVEPGPFIDGAL